MTVSCVPQFQASTNSSLVCNNGTWSTVTKCIPAKCTELPDAPRNGMVVAPNMEHGMVGKFEVGKGNSGCPKTKPCIPCIACILIVTESL